MNRTRTHDGADLAWWSTGRGDPLLLIAGQAVTHHVWAVCIRWPSCASSSWNDRTSLHATCKK
jgi:hypothetical protein